MVRFVMSSLLAVGAGLTSAHAQPMQEASSQSIRVLSAGDQKGSPVLVFGAINSPLEFFQEVYVINVSEKPIVRIQLGWVARPASANSSQGVAAVSIPSDVMLAPLQATTLGRQGATDSAVTEAINANYPGQSGLIDLTIGCVYAKFADGTEWSYNLLVQRHFEQQKNDDLRQRTAPVIKSFLEKQKTKLKQKGWTNSAASRPQPEGQRQKSRDTSIAAQIKTFLTSLL